MALDDYVEEIYMEKEKEKRQEKAKPLYDLLTQEQLKSDMDNIITDAQSVLQVPRGICRLLLQAYNWNKDTLFDHFYESPDTATFLNTVHIGLPDPGIVFTMGECDVCFEMGELSGPSCSHKACAGCWKGYLEDKIRSDGVCDMNCMMPNCELLLEDEKVLFYITDPALISLYHKLTVNNYVSSNRRLKWCPGIDCGRAVKLPDTSRHFVSCPCGAEFCSSCGHDFHEPLTCEMMKKWNSKTQESSKTLVWIARFTKPCPKCSTPIEKDGGCNVIVCTLPTCRLQFCWICMRPFDKDHMQFCSYYDVSQNTGDEATEDRVNVARHLFYHDRYIGHRQSLEFERKLRKIVDSNIEYLRLDCHASGQLKTAMEALFASRRTLMNSYIFAFFLQKDNNARIFENNQADLHGAVEKLSKTLHDKIKKQRPENLGKLLTEIHDKCVYVEHRRKILLDHCKEGYDYNFWKFEEQPF
ncbi:hypothetical protein CAEBREN_02583 [Caenorhabditis brenneri]|uniref:RBR-type E3 ubiquitin transferase n=1 Tax=Caenorhabditis brenneri TaxID=135651 RepID=G0MD16_CAEBE|nr:hypothetical protein CAEBREN_02583 [Caenorhabditis brenneri]